MYGLRFDPEITVNECAMCNLIGHASAGAQTAIVELENTRDDWINELFIQEGQVFQKIKKLLAIFLLLTAFGVNLDIIWRSTYITQLINNLVDSFDSEWIDRVWKNVVDNWWTQTVVLSAVPGNPCE